MQPVLQNRKFSNFHENILMKEIEQNITLLFVKYLQLYNSRTNTSDLSLVLGKMDGLLIPGFHTFQVRRSLKNYVALEFSTDASVEDRGFSATIYSGERCKLTVDGEKFSLRNIKIVN